MTSNKVFGTINPYQAFEDIFILFAIKDEHRQQEKDLENRHRQQEAEAKKRLEAEEATVRENLRNIQKEKEGL